LKKDLEIAVPIIVIIACIVFIVAYLNHKPISSPKSADIYGPHAPIKIAPNRRLKQTVTTVPSQKVTITDESEEVFAYAHGTVVAHNRIYIGMAARRGNLFATNQLIVFYDPNDLKQYRIFSIPRSGDIESMVYDEKNDKIYFTLSNNGSLEIYRMDPNSFRISTVISTTSVDIGLKPAITTDGQYIYGISYKDPSTVFKVGVNGGPLETSLIGHIPMGHSAAIGVYGSTTEIYFGGGEGNGFEKVRASDLASLGSLMIPGCSITDDMPYEKIDDVSGYVYLGCERQPFGMRVKTDDFSMTRFVLSGKSFGMFIYGDDLYNAAQDGNIDVFNNMNISDLKRYNVGKDIQLNELFVVESELPHSTSTALVIETQNLTQPSKNVLFTGWWGVKGLFKTEIPVVE